MEPDWSVLLPVLVGVLTVLAIGLLVTVIVLARGRRAPRPAEPAAPVAHVVVTRIDLSMWNLIALMVRIAIAAIPAALIVGLLSLVVGILFFGWLGHR